MTIARRRVVLACLSAACAFGAAGTFAVPAYAAGTTPVAMESSYKAVLPNGGTAHVTGTLGVTLGQTESVTVTRTSRLGTQVLPSVPVATDGTFAFDDAPGTTGPISYLISYAGDDTYAAGTTGGTSYEKVLPFDFNGDGFAETVTGSDGEDIGSIKDAGSFYVFKGTATGVTTTGSKAYNQGTGGLVGTAEKSDFFGETETSGDFNGDGFADLAVSAPGETIDGKAGAGDVTILFGSASGLTTTGSVVDYGGKVKDAAFGLGLATGDFNGDGTDELAAGAPGIDSVYVYTGISPGHAGTATKFVQGTGGVPGAAASGGDITQFGFNLSVGDVNGDGMDDLAIGAPWDYETRGFASGSVVVLYGTAEYLSTAGDQYFTLDTSGVVGTPSSFGKDEPDDFGWQARLADVNGDGRADLVVASPGTPVTNSSGKHEDAGVIYLLKSVNGAITGTGSSQYTQDTAGITGSPGKGDAWGSTLIANDLNGDGKADIVVTGTDRYVDYIPGSSSGPVTTSSKSFTQSTSGIVGTDTSGDDWGESVMAVSAKGAGPAALVIGAPGKHSGKGSISVLYSTSSGPTGTGSLYLDQDSTNVPGTAETGDFMGTFFQ